MNKGFLQTGNLKMSAMQKREFPRGISETDSAVTQNVECAEEFEIPVACQGVEVRSQKRKKGSDKESKFRSCMS